MGRIWPLKTRYGTKQEQWIRYFVDMFSFKFIPLGEAHKVDPGRQMVQIMELDYVDDVVS